MGGDGQGFLAIRSHNSKVPHLTWRTTTIRCEGKYIPSHQPMEVRKVIASLPLSSEGNFEWHISFAAYILLANAVSLIIYHFYPAGIPIRLWLFGIKMTVNTILRYVRIIFLLLYFVVDFRWRFHGKRRQLIASFSFAWHFSLVFTMFNSFSDHSMAARSEESFLWKSYFASSRPSDIHMYNKTL